MERIHLIPVSIKLLYVGLTVPHDIYDAGGSRLLISRGHKLDGSKIKAIGNLNGGKDTIYVSAETHKLMIEHDLSCNVVNMASVERETGYTGVKEEALTLLEEIRESGGLPQDSLETAALGLSKTLEETPSDIVLNLINALAPVDEYLPRHSVNVSLLNGLIGKWMKLPDEEVNLLILTGLLHDCGKAVMPSKVLTAPRRLTGVEFEVIKTHAHYSYDLLEDFPDTVRLGVRGHHEKLNGRGYPDNLFHEDIPFAARVTAVSDIYDAMVSRRTYKEPQSPFYTLSRLREMGGTELDAGIVETFIENMPKELLGKAVVMNNGEIGVVAEIDYNKLKFPLVRLHGRMVKCSRQLYVKSMYFE